MRAFTNRSGDGQGFALPSDGWIPLVENGETPVELANGETIVQVVDATALQAMIRAFDPADKSARIDFDHFSYEPDKSSEAAGWNARLEIRNGDLMSQARWSDAGKAALINGRFRFISPAFDPARLEELGRDEQGRRRVRPLRLDSAGLTNNPNMRLAPLTNRVAIQGQLVANDERRRAAGDCSVIANRIRSAHGCTFKEAWNQARRMHPALFNRASQIRS